MASGRSNKDVDGPVQVFLEPQIPAKKRNKSSQSVATGAAAAERLHDRPGFSSKVEHGTISKVERGTVHKRLMSQRPTTERRTSLDELPCSSIWKNARTVGMFNLLDYQTCLKVVSFLDRGSVLALSRTNHSLRVLALDTWIWQQLAERDFTVLPTDNSLQTIGIDFYKKCYQVKKAQFADFTRVKTRKDLVPMLSREGHGMFKMGDFVYILGGFSDCGAVFCMDTTSTRPSWRLINIGGTYSPGWVYGFALHTYGNNIVMFGGMSEPGYGGELNKVSLGTMELSLDDQPKALQWTPLTTKLRGGDEVPAVGYCASCIHSDKLYIFGGIRARQVTNSFYCLDLNTMVWSSPPVSGGNLPEPRCGGSLHAIGDELYLIGGGKSSSLLHGKDLSDVHTYNVKTHEWKEVTFLGSPHFRNLGVAHASCVVGRSVALFGGGDELSDTLTVMDVDRKAWAKPIVSGEIPMKRCSSTMCHIGGGKLLVMGGFSDEVGSLGDTYLISLGVKGTGHAVNMFGGYRTAQMHNIPGGVDAGSMNNLLFKEQLWQQRLYEIKNCGNKGPIREPLVLMDLYHHVPIVVSDDELDMRDNVSELSGNCFETQSFSKPSSSGIEGDIIDDDDLYDDDEGGGESKAESDNSGGIEGEVYLDDDLDTSESASHEQKAKTVTETKVVSGSEGNQGQKITSPKMSDTHDRSTPLLSGNNSSGRVVLSDTSAMIPCQPNPNQITMHTSKVESPVGSICSDISDI